MGNPLGGNQLTFLETRTLFFLGNKEWEYRVAPFGVGGGWRCLLLKGPVYFHNMHRNSGLQELHLGIIIELRP